jgi:hypothetical protein
MTIFRNRNISCQEPNLKAKCGKDYNGCCKMLLQTISSEVRTFVGDQEFIRTGQVR